MANKQNKGGGAKKYGREKKKRLNKGSAMSLFVRGKISAEQYFKLTNQAVKAR